MKIGISTSVIQRGKTGIAQYLFALLRAFQNANTEHRFVLFVLEEDKPFFKDYRDDRFEIVIIDEKFRPPIKNILWHQTILPRLARQLELDVIHREDDAILARASRRGGAGRDVARDAHIFIVEGDAWPALCNRRKRAETAIAAAIAAGELTE